MTDDVDGDGRNLAPSASGGPHAAPPWTWRRGWQNLLWVYLSGLVFLSFSIVDLVSGEFDRLHTVIGSVQLLLVAAAYVATAWIADVRLAVRTAHVVGFAALMVSTAIVWGWGFANLGVYLAIMVATLIPWRLARAVIPVIGVLLASVTLITGDPTPAFLAVISLGVGLATAAGIESGRVSHRLALAEQRLSVLAVAAERERIGRDLHDILGHSLTAISIKTGLAARLIDQDAAAAKVQLEEIADISRQALADVRSTASGFRQIRVVTEVASAGSVLTAAGITPSLPSAIEPMPDRVSELFGYVVREAVTNVVRHSEATTCRITVDPYAVSVTDDGRGFPTGHRRSGLRGLEERVAAAGGRLEVASSRAGTRVSVGLPLPTFATPALATVRS